MANKLYVGNLPYSATSDELKSLFGQAGTVEDAIVLSDKFTGRSKGFGFVTMSNDEEAKKAEEMFNNYDMGGRQIRVNEAKPQTDRPRRDSRGFGGGGRDY